MDGLVRGAMVGKAPWGQESSRSNDHRPPITDSSSTHPVPIIGGVKAILAVLVYLCFIVALGVITLTSRRPEECQVDISDDDDL
jgi:hypothetical protein